MNSIQQTMPEAGQWGQLSFPAVEAVDPVGCQFVHQAGSVSLQYAPKDRPNQASDLMQPVVKSGGESLIVPDYVVNNKTRALTLRMTGGERILFESWFYFKAPVRRRNSYRHHSPILTRSAIRIPAVLRPLNCSSVKRDAMPMNVKLLFWRFKLCRL